MEIIRADLGSLQTQSPSEIRLFWLAGDRNIGIPPDYSQLLITPYLAFY